MVMPVEEHEKLLMAILDTVTEGEQIKIATEALQELRADYGSTSEELSELAELKENQEKEIKELILSNSRNFRKNGILETKLKEKEEEKEPEVEDLTLEQLGM